MKRLDHIDNSAFILGAILLIANKMSTLLDRDLSKYNITSKQMFLLLVLFNFFEHPPTIKQIAKEMGSSHQNVKQIALKLEEKGLVKLEKATDDLRVTRISATEKSHLFWKDSENDAKTFMDKFYVGAEQNTLENTRLFLSQLITNLEIMEKNI
jgi:DNA-binding MarR family transcriptional regulator